MERKPNGFWTRDAAVQAIMRDFVTGAEDLDVTTDALCAYCAELRVEQSREAIAADVKWYARGFRKALGLPSVLEAKRSAQAQVELQG